jgi:hypothetical protein
METNKKKSVFTNLWVIGIGTGVATIITIRIIDWMAKTSILLYIFNFLKLLLNIPQNILTLKVTFSIWLILLIMVGIGLFFFLKKYVTFSTQEEIHEDSTKDLITPDFLNYTSDIFDDVKYRWRFSRDYSGKYSIVDFEILCKKDNCILLYNHCPICKNYYTIKSQAELQVLVRHKIENNLYSS